MTGKECLELLDFIFGKEPSKESEGKNAQKENDITISKLETNVEGDEP